MVEYKRNQVEEAISAVADPRSEEPTAELRTQLKRLLDTDRAGGRQSRSNNPARANYAFYSAEPPGRGMEVWFSAYEAFALLIGLLLLGHGWPQGFAVSVMRRVRPELQSEHTRILKQDASQLFDQEAILRNARAGDVAVDNTDPVFLMIVSKSKADLKERQEPHACGVCRGREETVKFFGKVGDGLMGRSMFELVGLAHRLSAELSRTEPRHRGRG